MTMKSLPMISAGILTALIPAAAFASFAAGDSMGTTDLDEIRAKFEAQGYTVLEVEAEDGEIEVEYLMDGQEFEVTIAAPDEPVQLGEKKLPDLYIVLAHYLAWAVVTAIVFWLAGVI